MATIATVFSGGEGVGIGARSAGLHHLWGIDNDDAIAQVARDNGFEVITANVARENPQDYERPDVLHASPPCPNFSNAKVGGEESDDDIKMARATARFIEALAPRVFTLENVWMYRKSESWRLIADTLNRLGYWMTVQHLNAADFGVPQTRKRMIVRAVLNGWLPPLPAPEPWRRWYQAVEDLLPGLPDSEFAPWQLERGIQDLLDANASCEQRHRVFLATGYYGQPAGIPDRKCQTACSEDPSPTVTASAKGDWRAAIPGRVVRMTPRCLARFQTLPDSYQLPESNTLAARIIGNAMPPLWYEKLVCDLMPRPSPRKLEQNYTNC